MLAADNIAPELGRIACPALLTAGRHDGLRPPSIIEPMAKQVPGGQFLALNSGHFAPVQTPALVAQAMHAYLHAVGLDRQDFGGRILAADLMAAGFWRLVHDLVRLAGRVAGCAA